MLRVTQDQADVILRVKRRKKKRVNKYGAKKCIVNGTKLDSLREGKRYNDLIRLQMGKKITDLELQPTYQITIDGIAICKVKLDFRYYDKARKQTVIEDSKGRDNPMSRLKRKLVEAQHKIKVEIV